jgi:lysophospholipase
MIRSALESRLPPGAQVGEWLAPDGWRHRRFDLPAERPRGRLLFQGGRSDVFEKYLEAIEHLRDRGWSVTSFDWRGQGGSGRLSRDPRVGHADDFKVFVRDLAAFWRDWSAVGDGPRAVLGHSMGGHLVLRALADRGIAPDAAVLSAPMIRVRSPLGAWIGSRIARGQARRGATRPAWRWSEDPRKIERRRRRLTLDKSRGQDERWWYEVEPDLELGPPSWGWIAEAFASGDALEGDPRLDQVRTPVLMLVADGDRLVDPRAARRVAARLPRCELVRFAATESAHEILRESLPVQRRAFVAIDRFLDRETSR